MSSSSMTKTTWTKSCQLTCTTSNDSKSMKVDISIKWAAKYKHRFNKFNTTIASEERCWLKRANSWRASHVNKLKLSWTERVQLMLAGEASPVKQKMFLRCLTHVVDLLSQVHWRKPISLFILWWHLVSSTETGYVLKTSSSSPSKGLRSKTSGNQLKRTNIWCKLELTSNTKVRVHQEILKLGRL